MKKKDDKKQIYLHIGIQRTGTTFLQEEVFPNIKEINFVERKKEIITILMSIEQYNHEIVSKKIYSHIQQNKINLISEENIYCGYMWTKEDNRFEKIEKIKQFFPNAKIIFGIRGKTDLLLSWYKKYVACGGVLSFKEYQKKVINIENLNFWPYVKCLFEYFGEKNVYIYKFENMKKDIHSFVDGICRFLGVETPNFKNRKRNVGYSLYQLKMSLLINKFFKTPLNPNGVFPLQYGRHPHRKIFQSPYFPQKLRGKKFTIQDLK